MRRAAKRDANHAAIRDALRGLGVWTWDTGGLGDGFPDLMSWDARRGCFVLLEVKDGTKPPSARKLTKAEQDFFDACPGPVYVVNSLDEALVALGLRRAA